MLRAISPLDGRYRSKLESASEFFSEFALISSRCRVELLYLQDLNETGLFPKPGASEKKRIADLLSSFSEKDAESVKAIEETTRHDVKAVEYFLRDRLKLENPNLIHFGLTSEDVNNLAYSLLFSEFLQDLYFPELQALLVKLCEMAENWSEVPFPTRTHGQPASPSTAGKELAVFISRLSRIAEKLLSFKFSGKLNGAVGNYSAMVAAFPDFRWADFSKKFVESLGLEFNPATTQIEDHDRWAEFFNTLRQLNNIVIDLDQDIWNYLMLGLFTEESVEGEVGSSTMPHKVNPIRFENSEGNLLLANSLLVMFSEKLCRSRMQRDLSDSTVCRNIGVALSHSLLALGETIEGLKRISLNKEMCLETIRDNVQLLAEPIQTILRTLTTDDPYEWLKKITRGKKATIESLHDFIEKLSLKPADKKRLKSLKIETYVGDAPRICREIVKCTRRMIASK